MKSEKLYVWLQRLLIVLLILEIAIGLSIAIICEYLKELVQSRIFKFDKQDVLSVVFIVKLFGLHVSFYFLCGVPIVLLLNEVYTIHMVFLLKIWLLMAIETAVGSIFIIWCFSDATKFLIENFQISLENGIKMYPQDPAWALIWDDLQYQFKCCGVHDHIDWNKVNLTTSGKKTLRQSKDFCWLPYSCANGNFPLKSSLRHDNIYTNGCYTVISRIINYVNSAIFSLNITSIILLVRFVKKKCLNLKGTNRFRS